MPARAIQWLRFEWPPDQIPPLAPPALSGSYAIAALQPEETGGVEDFLARSILADSEWNSCATTLQHYIRNSVAAALELPIPLGLLLRHGGRIIGLSILDPAPDSPNHLVSGPCVLSEYRNRGFGTLLLSQSLGALIELGFPKVVGFTLASSTAGKFVYPKFGGVPVPTTLPPCGEGGS